MHLLEEHIISINSKLQILLKNYAALQKENNLFLSEIKKHEENEKNFLEKINVLEIQTGILKPSAGKMDSNEKKDFEKRIDAYIKDIDKCIVMLNN